MRIISVVSMCVALAACSHIPLISDKAAAGNVVGVVEYDTGLTKFSTVTGVYHQDMCSKANGDVAVHLSDREMKKILATADKTGYYKAPTDMTTDWTGTGKPPNCAGFRLHVESGPKHNDVRWDCGRNGSNAPPPQVAPLVDLIQKALRSRKEVKAMPWSNCQVR